MTERRLIAAWPSKKRPVPESTHSPPRQDQLLASLSNETHMNKHSEPPDRGCLCVYSFQACATAHFQHKRHPDDLLNGLAPGLGPSTKKPAYRLRNLSFVFLYLLPAILSTTPHPLHPPSCENGKLSLYPSRAHIVCPLPRVMSQSALES